MGYQELWILKAALDEQTIADQGGDGCLNVESKGTTCTSS